MLGSVASLFPTMALTDAELARRIHAREPDAAGAEAELFLRFARRIRSYGLRHLRDAAAADDLVQQVLVAVLESLRGGKVRDGNQLASFVLGTCRMIARGSVKGDARHERLLEKYPAIDEAVRPAAVVDTDRLHTCLEKLPPKERAVVVLTFYAERSGDEIAVEVGATPGNVRVIRHRAMSRLQNCMELTEAAS
jgi:RNA polymerase sigma-70 factor, ECF subfamily